MKKIKIFCCLAFILILTSCTEEWERNIEFDKKTFYAERTEWQTKRPFRYSFVLESFDSSPWEPVRITVLNGSLVSAEFVHMSNEEVYWFKKDTIRTIDDIFTYIESEFAQDDNNDDIIYIKVEINYDAQYHFPQKVYYSFSKKPPDGVPKNGVYKEYYNGYRLAITNFSVISVK